MPNRLTWPLSITLCLLVAIALANSHFLVSKAAPAKGGWEYRVVTSSNQHDDDQETLNQLAQEGFELVSVDTATMVQVPQAQRTVYVQGVRVFYLKRATK